MARQKKAQSAVSSCETAFAAIDKKMWFPGSGCSGALDYMEQSSWLLFLRYLDAREEERKLDAEMIGEPYEPALPEELRWSTWAYPTKEDGSFDDEASLRGDDLIFFVQQKLFPGLKMQSGQANGLLVGNFRIFSMELPDTIVGKEKTHESDLFIGGLCNCGCVWPIVSRRFGSIGVHLFPRGRWPGLCSRILDPRKGGIQSVVSFNLLKCLNELEPTSVFRSVHFHE